jgi:hypothetical protein
MWFAPGRINEFRSGDLHLWRDWAHRIKGFEIMMAACRSVVQRRNLMLPLGAGEPEWDALKQVLSAVHAGDV